MSKKTAEKSPENRSVTDGLTDSEQIKSLPRQAGRGLHFVIILIAPIICIQWEMSNVWAFCVLVASNAEWKGAYDIGRMSVFYHSTKEWSILIQYIKIVL